MTGNPEITGRKPIETMSDRELLEEVAEGSRHLLDLLRSLGINGKVTYMDLAGIARKVRRG